MIHMISLKLKKVVCPPEGQCPIYRQETGLLSRLRAGVVTFPKPRWDVLSVPFAALALLFTWQLLVWLTRYPSFVLPSPADVFNTAQRVIADGTLWRHTSVTLAEVGGGLGLGLVAAFLLGYPLAKSRQLERLSTPFLIVSQSVPIVAIAPLVIIWFGSGPLSKVLISALIVFFPLLISIVVGIRDVPKELHELMRSLEASRWQTFWWLEVPSALPVFLGGLRIGVTLSVVGAVVGEFVGADQGLGFMINQARGLFNTPLVFVAVLTLVVIALTLYGLVMLLEKWLLRWRDS
jgi:NitT/TauT family transport system permease protein